MGGTGSVLEMDSERRYGPIGWVQGSDRSSELHIAQGHNRQWPSED